MTNKQGNWEIKIRKVQNGYILETEEESDSEEGYFPKHEEVVEEINLPFGQDKSGELEAMMSVLLKIKDYFGVTYSKHNKQNINIEIVETKQDG